MEYKYINDTEAALKKIKAECKIKKCKPSFNDTLVILGVTPFRGNSADLYREH